MRPLVWAGGIVSVILLARLCLMGILGFSSREAPFAVPITIDVNRAPVPELMLLPGIGRERAEQIVLHRVRHGPFAELADLAVVPGIGPVTLERMAEFAVVERPE